jgi:hypothetical protein
MTEAEWLTSQDPEELLEFLWDQWLTSQNPEVQVEFLWDHASGRKLRLFCCACCRRIWELIPEVGGQTALEVAERSAEGVEDDSDRDACLRAGQVGLDSFSLETVAEDGDPDACLRAAGELGDCLTQASPRGVVGYDGNYKKAIIRSERSFAWAKQMAAEAIRNIMCTDPDFYTSVGWSDVLAARATGWAALTSWAKTFSDQKEIADEDADAVNSAAEQAERVYQSYLLKDLVGNPFRPASIAPVLRTPTIIALAQAAYDERVLPSGELDAVRLAALADALEEAVCTNPDILGHLREPGPHVRGCFVVDSCLCLA